ncbi:MAG: zinc-dependent metalloprotease, partial [Leadbetterella sp.]|nr:zinc-dependent metalloprotease [Leadbetterella sp.]
EQLGASTLGSATSPDFLIGFNGAKYVNTYYPLALAEKLAGQPLNSDAEGDIYCWFNSSISWHYGEPDDIPSGTFDFTTVVLHELGHGLGFISSMSTTGQTGNYGFGTPYKLVYDIFVENESGANLVDTTTFKNNSQPLFQQLTGNALYFEEGTGAARPRLFAPSPFRPSSSIAHLNDSSYPSGDPNSLMTSTARTMEVKHDPGPLVLSALYKMGWKSTSIVHERLKNYPRNTPSVTFKANILSDTTLKQGTAKLYYETSGGVRTADLVRTTGTNEYSVKVDFPSTVTEVRYYFEVQDDFGNTVRAPGNNGLNTTQYVYGFRFGDDVTAPTVVHTPLSIEDVSFPGTFGAFVDDDFEDGLASVTVNYQVNGGSQASATLQKYDPALHGEEFSVGDYDKYLYLLIDPIPGLRTGDQVRYQLVARDKAGNNTTLPTEYTSTRSADPPVASFYEYTVTSLLGTRDSYSTDFENGGNDFAVVGFKVGTEEGFPTQGLHSAHPYRNGLGLLDPEDDAVLVNFDRNDLAMLRYPLRLGQGTNTTVTFDEVVLVEPGEAGSQYGDSDFFDYVVVEGSVNGADWFPLEDGYDSRAHTLWQERFNASMSGGEYPNSTTQGNVTLTKKRTISINAASLGVSTGQPMLLRFRLYSDQLANGWGWAIDNLYIQENAPVVLANEEPGYGITLYPNPSTEHIDIQMTLSKAQKVQLEIFSMNGGKVYSENITVAGTEFNHRIGVAGLPSGNYVLRVKEAQGSAFKRFTRL